VNFTAASPIFQLKSRNSRSKALNYLVHFHVTRPCKVLTNNFFHFYFTQPWPVKTDQEIIESSMAEDDPNCISEEDDEEMNPENPRWGRKHKGAQILANFYSRGG
jgi:hypothetical protein